VVLGKLHGYSFTHRRFIRTITTHQKKIILQKLSINTRSSTNKRKCVKLRGIYGNRGDIVQSVQELATMERFGIRPQVGARGYYLLHTRPDRPWGQLSPQYGGSQPLFPWVQWPGPGVDPHLARSLRMSTAALLPWLNGEFREDLYLEFYVLLTVHHAMILGKWPTWRTNSFLCIYFLFITLYMFRVHRAHHQESQIVSIQPLVTVTLCWWPCRVQFGSRHVESYK
jgi:hypothetical protein